MGSLAPIIATGTYIFSLTLGAPHTIESTSSPTLTLHTLNLSASGCLCTVKTLPIITPGISPPVVSIEEISLPERVIFLAISSTSKPSKLTNSFNQLKGILIIIITSTNNLPLF